MNDKTQAPELDVNEQIAQRKAKLAALRERGVAFPNDFRRDSLAADLHHDYDHWDKEALAEKGVRVRVAGRMITRRIMGKASFATIQDRSEEHTSELQSRENLVCRLLLEKKKEPNYIITQCN